ncbi:unnamed protein product [Durusdinium trenchii]|uniref:Uncharacterized protein n=1 Tax=Durusdinium trenchii TaxID=1381693 RepID=A0ABP0M5F4_9DINO
MEGLVNGSTVTGHVPRGERTPGLLLSGAADDRRGLRTDRQNGGAEDRNGVGASRAADLSSNQAPASQVMTPSMALLDTSSWSLETVIPLAA